MAVKKLSEQRARTIAREILSYRNWNISSPSTQGQVLEENEYKNYPEIANIFKGKSKTGSGDGYPDFLVLESSCSKKPVIIIETKATVKDLDKAINEATFYADALIENNINVLAVGIAGGDKELFGIEVKKKINGVWKNLLLNNSPIDWIPSLKQVKMILEQPELIDVLPERPGENILNSQANRLNEILRECKIKDEYRPIYVATFMLALWKGDVSVDEEVVLGQINHNCHLALKKASKQDLSESLRIDEQNTFLAAKAWQIIDILKKLNIRSFIQEHDYLGQLYETFFRYTGGNTIGQYFTPRHIIEFICEMMDISIKDIIFDPTCGTGGFLIGALNHIIKNSNLVYEDAINIVKDNLFGIESEPTTAALCIANMILRGDGKSGIVKKDCFELQNYPSKEVDCVLMNPPFPHNKKTDTPPTKFIDRGLKSLKNRGKLASIVPYSLLVKEDVWHKEILKNNTLLAVITLPADLFNPYASYNTAIILLEKGIPHNNKPVFFAKITNDGYKLKKNTRIKSENSQLEEILDAYIRKIEKQEVHTYKSLNPLLKEWSPEAYLENAPHSDKNFILGLEDSIRQQASFYVYLGHKLFKEKENKTIIDIDYFNNLYNTDTNISFNEIELKPFCLADYFDIKLGGKDEIEDLEDGDVPLVSTSEFMNGITTWKSAPISNSGTAITVATDGSTCSSFVQEFPFYAFYKVAIITPREEYKNIIPIDALYYISYLLRCEKWRYVYARKFGKQRLSRTILYLPTKNNEPDFKKMSEIVKKTHGYHIIKSFRKAFK